MVDVASLLVDSVLRGEAPEQVLEHLLTESFQITSHSIERLYTKVARSHGDRDLAENLSNLMDYLSGYYESPYRDVDPKEMKHSTEQWLEKLSSYGKKAIAAIKGGHVNEPQLERTLLGRPPHRLFEDPWPIPVYVSAAASDENTIGLLVHEGGKLEMFEGNDEASDATLELVDELLGLGAKKVTVYGSHNQDVVDQIKQHGELPANLYVSPSKSHASGYWGEDRVLFSCEIPMSAVSQESHVDWRVRKPVKINKFKYA